MKVALEAQFGSAASFCGIPSGRLLRSGATPLLSALRSSPFLKALLEPQQRKLGRDIDPSSGALMEDGT